MWQAVAIAASAATGAGIAAGVAAGAGMAAGSAALTSTFISATGFVYNQGLTALGASEELAGIVSSLITLSMGSANAVMSSGLMQVAQDEIITNVTTTTVSESILTATQQNVESYIMSQAMLNDEIWDELMEELAKDYRAESFIRFNLHRERLKNAIESEIDRLCRINNSLDELVQATREAQERNVPYLHSSHWRDLWNEALRVARQRCTCCEWSNGTPGRGCSYTVPDFGYSPDE
jgi:hypothetical protein